MDRPLGADYTLDLSDAIGAALAAAGRAAFVYRGSDLAHAVERELFVQLVNDDGLHSAYETRRQGGEAQVPRLPGRVQQDVARLLLGRGTLRAKAGLAALRSRGRAAPIHSAGGDDGPLCYLLDHAKFLSFVAPLLQADTGDAHILSATDELLPALRESGIAHTALDYASRAQPAYPSELGKGLRERDYLAVVHDVITEALENVRPRALFVVEGNGPFDEVASRAARALGIPSICLQQGWSPVIHSGFRNMSFTRMTVWGPAFARLLQPYNPQQRFESVGHHLAIPDADGEHDAIVFFLQSTSPIIAPSHLEQLHGLVLAAADRLRDRRILVRQHPGAPLASDVRTEMERRRNVSFADDMPLAEVLATARTSVSIYSTTLLESAAAGVPPIVFNPTSLTRPQPDLAALGAAVDAAEVDTALEAIDRLASDDDYHGSFAPAMDRFRTDFFAAPEGAAERVVRLARTCPAT